MLSVVASSAWLSAAGSGADLGFAAALADRARAQYVGLLPMGSSKPILEINPHNERIRALAGLAGDDTKLRDDLAHLLYDEARVLDGDKPADAKAFSERLARLVTRAIGNS